MKTTDSFLDKLPGIAVPAVVALAVLWVAIASTNIYQGWGGDYAGYVGQARSVVEGRSLAASNYLYNPAVPSLAPPAYPMGFPLVLSPLYALFGNNMLVFCRFVSVTWWLVGVALFFFLRRRFSWSIALVTSLLLLFNPYVFDWKKAMLPDYLFTVILLGGAYWYIYKDKNLLRNALICGFLVGWAWLMRANGVVLLLAIGVDMGGTLIANWKKEGLPKNSLKYGAIVLGMAVGLQLVVHNLLFHMPPGGSYFDQVKEISVGIVRQNLDEILRCLLLFFQLEPKMTYYDIVNKDIAVQIGGAMALGAAVWGLITAKGPEYRFLRWFLGLFMAVLLVWPSVQNFRYMFPMYPVLLLFAVAAIDHMMSVGRARTMLKWAIIPLLLFGAYDQIDEIIYVKVQVEENGAPEYTNNQEAYQYVREHMPADARFAYHHPLIFGLYADRKAMHWSDSDNADKILEELKQYNVQYLLVNGWLLEHDNTLQKFLSAKKDTLNELWHNERNTLYQLK